MNANLQNKANFDQLTVDEQILQRTASYRTPQALSTDDALERLRTRIDRSETIGMPRHSQSIQIINWSLSMAASIALLLSVWYFGYYNATTTILAEKGKHTEYELPDGTKISMNAESSISFQKHRFAKNRYVKLEGEAFFSVKKGSKFTIQTPLASIKILGTSFNVYARNQSFKVSCFTGKIEVTSAKHAVVITPGQSAEVVNKDLLKYEDKNLESSTQWRTGDFNFDYSPLKTVFNEIERQYNVTFVTPEIGSKYFSGSFTNRNLVEALDIVCIPMGLTYEIGSNGQIFIREKQK